MKVKFLLLILSLLLFACSNDGFESQVAASSQKNVFCRIADKCSKISKKLCDEIGDEVETCELEEPNYSSEVSSSSSDEVSSSSDDEASSSSGDEVSSSSDDEASSSSGDEVSSSSGDEVSSSSGDEVSSSSGDEVSSSSGDEVSSSSGDEVSSSSSDEVSSSSLSSSSVPEAPSLSGSFEFRNFDYSSSSSKIYFLTANIYWSDSPSSNGGTSKIFNTLKINNATAAECDTTIAVEVEGGGLPTIVPPRPMPSPPNNPTAPGQIIAKAIATCNGEKKTLKTDTAMVVAAPSLGDCKLPSTYLHKGDVLTDLVEVENNYGRCTLTYEVANYAPSSPTVTKPPVGATLSLTNYVGKTITVRAQVTGTSCPFASTTKTCTATTEPVAENYVEFTLDNNNPKVSFNDGSTVIGMKMTNQQTGIGCEYKDQSGKPNVVFYITTPNGKVGSEGAPEGLQPWWTTLTPLPMANYTSNGNRILFETENGGIECAPI